MLLNKPLIKTLPSSKKVNNCLGDALRQVRLLRGLLRLAERAELYRDCDRAAAEVDAAPSRKKTACSP